MKNLMSLLLITCCCSQIIQLIKPTNLVVDSNYLYFEIDQDIPIDLASPSKQIYLLPGLPGVEIAYCVIAVTVTDSSYWNQVIAPTILGVIRPLIDLERRERSLPGYVSTDPECFKINRVITKDGFMVVNFNIPQGGIVRTGLKRMVSHPNAFTFGISPGQGYSEIDFSQLRLNTSTVPVLEYSEVIHAVTERVSQLEAPQREAFRQRHLELSIESLR